MDSQNVALTGSWNHLKTELQDRLTNLWATSASLAERSSRCISLARELLFKLNDSHRNVPLSDSQEIEYYKSVYPFFLSKIGLYSRIFRIEADQPPTNAEGLIEYYKMELESLSKVYEEHRFIYRYLLSGATHLDQKLFFRSEDAPVIALNGGASLADGAFPVCYDHVVAEIMAADALKDYLVQRISTLSIATAPRAQHSKLTWTAPKAHFIELVYALYASGVFNNGKALLKDIFQSLEEEFQISAGNYPRTMQEILYRKSGYTVFQDFMRNNYLLYIQKIEEKHIG